MDLRIEAKKIQDVLLSEVLIHNDLSGCPTPPPSSASSQPKSPENASGSSASTASSSSSGAVSRSGSLDENTPPANSDSNNSPNAETPPPPPVKENNDSEQANVPRNVAIQRFEQSQSPFDRKLSNAIFRSIELLKNVELKKVQRVPHQPTLKYCSIDYSGIQENNFISFNADEFRNNKRLRIQSNDLLKDEHALKKFKPNDMEILTKTHKWTGDKNLLTFLLQSAINCFEFPSLLKENEFNQVVRPKGVEELKIVDVSQEAGPSTKMEGAQTGDSVMKEVEEVNQKSADETMQVEEINPDEIIQVDDDVPTVSGWNKSKEVIQAEPVRSNEEVKKTNDRDELFRKNLELRKAIQEYAAPKQTLKKNQIMKRYSCTMKDLTKLFYKLMTFQCKGVVFAVKSPRVPVLPLKKRKFPPEAGNARQIENIPEYKIPFERPIKPAPPAVQPDNVFKKPFSPSKWSPIVKKESPLTPKFASNVNAIAREVADKYPYECPTNPTHYVIGPHGSTISKESWNKIDWTQSPAAITRKILICLFDRNTLATHSLSGRPSPAFKHIHKPEKQPLDAGKVSDTVSIITSRVNVTPKEVRMAITTKCADECKMLKQREEKKARDNNRSYLQYLGMELIN